MRLLSRRVADALRPSADDGRNERQLGVVDAHGNAASYTGSACLDWAGHRTGHCYAAQGNILVGPETVAALADTFEATAGQSLALRLLECLAAAQRAGGDRRGQQSAALLLVERDGGYAGNAAIEPFIYQPDGPICAARQIGYIRGVMESLQ